MTFRKWFLRLSGLLLGFTLLAGAFLWQQWANPSHLRQLVLDALRRPLSRAEIKLESVQVSWFGGVRLRHLTCTLGVGSETPVLITVPDCSLELDRGALAKGRVAFTKIVLQKPEILLPPMGERTGSWSGALEALQALNGPGPVIQIRNGEIRCQLGSHESCIHRIHVGKLTAQPAETAGYVVHAQGDADRFGPWEIKADLGSVATGARGEITLADVPLSGELVRNLKPWIPETVVEELDVQGRLGLVVQAHARAGEQPQLSWLVRGEWRDGKLSHPRLPAPLDHIEARIAVCPDAVTVQCGSAACLGGMLQGSGTWAGEKRWDVTLQAQRLAITPDVLERCPGRMKTMAAEFQPRGKVDLALQASATEGKIVHACTIGLAGMRLVYEGFPYPLEQTFGSINLRSVDGVPVALLDLRGKASGQPVRLTGRLHGPGLMPDCPLTAGVALKLVGERIPLDAQLVAALAPHPDRQRQLQQLHASGTFDVQVELNRAPGTVPGVRQPMDKRFVVQLRGVDFRFEKFPVTVRRATGTLLIEPDGTWSCMNFHGYRGRGTIQGQAALHRTPRGEAIHLDLRGVAVPLDLELFRALPEKAQRAWREVEPGGEVDGRVQLTLVEETVEGLDVRLVPRGATARLACFPYDLTDIQGTVHYADDLVRVSGLKARHGPAHVQLKDGSVVVRADGSLRVTLNELYARRLSVDRDLVFAAPPTVRGLLDTLQPQRPFDVLANVVIEAPGRNRPPRFGWSLRLGLEDQVITPGFPISQITGQVRCEGWHDGSQVQAKGELALDQVTLARQPLNQFRSTFELGHDVLKFPDFSAKLHDGSIDGSLRLVLNVPVAYDLDLTGKQIELEQFARKSLGRQAQTRGKLDGRLRLEGQGTDVRTWKGKGEMVVAEGAHLYDLPLILDLINHLSKHLPQGTSFQDALCHFTIEGERLHTARLELHSDALSLRGQGSMRVDGTDLRLEMYGLTWGRTIPLLPPLIDRIPPTISKQLMKFIIRGSFDKVSIRTEPLPIVVEPVMEALRFMKLEPALKQP
jgi:hypothetical protein